MASFARPPGHPNNVSLFLWDVYLTFWSVFLRPSEMHFSDIYFGWEQWGWRPCQAPTWPSCAPASSYKVLWEILSSYCRTFIIKIYINICLVVFFQETWVFLILSSFTGLHQIPANLSPCWFEEEIFPTWHENEYLWKILCSSEIFLLLPGPQPGDHAQLYYCREKERDSTSGRSTSRMMKQRGDGKARRKFDKNLIHWSQFLARINIELCSWLW